MYSQHFKFTRSFCGHIAIIYYDKVTAVEVMSVAVEPVALEPVALEPVAVEPVALEPVALEPVAVEPVAWNQWLWNQWPCLASSAGALILHKLCFVFHRLHPKFVSQSAGGVVCT